MVLILLTILGVPLWLVLGALGAGLWSRRTFRRAPGVLAVRCRTIRGADASSKWPRRACYARWIHDVLIVHEGIALVRNRAIPVETVLPSRIEPGELRKFGAHAVAVLLRADSGDIVEVAAAAKDRVALVGPFGNGALRQSSHEAAAADPSKSPDAGW